MSQVLETKGPFGVDMQKGFLALGMLLAFAAGIASTVIARQSATGDNGGDFQADFGNKTIAIRKASRAGDAAQVSVIFNSTKTAVLPFEVEGQATVVVDNVTCASRRVQIFRLAYPDTDAVGNNVGQSAAHFWGAPTIMVTRNSPGTTVDQIITGFLYKFASRDPVICLAPKAQGQNDSLPRVDGNSTLTALKIGGSDDYVYADCPGTRNLFAKTKLGHIDMDENETIFFENALETYFHTTCNGKSVPTFKVSWGMTVMNTIKLTRAETTGRVFLTAATVTANPDVTPLNKAKANGRFADGGLAEINCP